MKCVIIYFSQTGNTEKIALAIQAGVKQIAGHCDILKIKDANPRKLYQYDLIGLGSPCSQVGLFSPQPTSDGTPIIAGGVVPINVVSFARDIRFVGGKHSFIFCTQPLIPLADYFFPSVIPHLKRREMEVIGRASWYVNPYLPWHAEPSLTVGHPDEIDLLEAEKFGKEMVERSRKISDGEVNLIPPVPLMPPPMPRTKHVAWETDRRSLKFHAEKCRYPQCRLCMDNCPVDGIDLSLKLPVIGEPCQRHCAFCTMICPSCALEMDDFVEAQAQNYLDIQREQLPYLAKAEAEGRFRRLVPVEKIGFDTPFYKVHNKHPQWIIGKGPQ
jgi:ferredoxin